MEFKWTDIIPLVLSLALSILISFVSHRKEKSNQKLESHEPQLKLFPVIASLITSAVSGVALLGGPAESYQYGNQFQLFLTCLVLQSWIVTLSFLPIVLKLKGSSIYEYFELRFDWKIEKFALAQFMVAKIFTSSLHSLPPAIIISYFTGVSTNAMIVVILSVTTGYTMIGGLKGVVWTDTLQAIVMLIALIALVIASVLEVGGIGNVFQIAYDTDRLSLEMPALDPSVRLPFWAYLSGLNVAMTMNQSWYQRIKTLKSEREIKQSVMFQSLGLFLIGIGSSFTGLSIYAYYHGCDPKTAKVIDSYSNIVVYWLGDVGGEIPGLVGLYISGITCGSISSVSTSLNSVSATTVDVFMRSKGNRTRWIRIFTLFFGALTGVIALYIKNTGSLIELNYVIISLDGITGGLFILGALFIPSSVKGALAGAVTSALVTATLVLGSKKNLPPYPKKEMSTDLCTTISHHSDEDAVSETETTFILFKLSPFVYGMVAIVLTVVVGSAVSWLCPDGEQMAQKAANPDLYHPIVHRFLPREWLKRSRFNKEEVVCEEGATELLQANVNVLTVKDDN